MLSKILILAGLIIVFFIPKMMDYRTESEGPISDISTVSSSLNKTNKNLIGFKIPKIEALANTSQDFYPKESLNPKINNYLLLGSGTLIISGIILMEINNIGYFVKNQIGYSFWNNFLNLLKMI